MECLRAPVVPIVSPVQNEDERAICEKYATRVYAYGLRHLRERAAHLAVNGVRGQQRLGVHRIQVVHAVQQGRLDTVGAQRAGDDVEDDGAAQAADVHRPGRRLRIVDDLGPDRLLRKLVSPVHGDRAS